ncbi:group III truncated hemoglobin [uncultured Sulfitobacter sp.]|uniref:group III truncated hemoglobin n=1 Tax=uncultured Sulfitobacter sp. TaxID=191468 RepID=UPI0026082BF3|nr:group III truncated hemoglobin [uncultured Sulfitobacter sp.]
MPPRIAVSEAEIDRVVSQFYARVRVNPDLGPVFDFHVTDWPTHEEKIGRFWRNALLLHRSYEGNPMQIHKEAGNVRAEHFAIWLLLFDEVLAQELSRPLALAWSTLAHRIGRGLSYGLPHACGASGIPDLRS